MAISAIAARQAEKLNVKPRTQISPYLENCCLLVSANNSYQRSEEDLAVLTGIQISHSAHQRLVHRQAFDEIIALVPVEAVGVDGGKVILRTPEGEPSIFNDYKAAAKSMNSFKI